MKPSCEVQVRLSFIMLKIIIGYGLHVCACIEAQNPHSMCMQVPPALTKLSHTRAVYILDQRYLRTPSQLVKPINSVSFSTSEGRLTDQLFTLHLWFLDCSSPLGKKKNKPKPHTPQPHTDCPEGWGGGKHAVLNSCLCSTAAPKPE